MSKRSYENAKTQAKKEQGKYYDFFFFRIFVFRRGVLYIQHKSVETSINKLSKIYSWIRIVILCLNLTKSLLLISAENNNYQQILNKKCLLCPNSVLKL